MSVVSTLPKASTDSDILHFLHIFAKPLSIHNIHVPNIHYLKNHVQLINCTTLISSSEGIKEWFFVWWHSYLLMDYIDLVKVVEVFGKKKANDFKT